MSFEKLRRAVKFGALAYSYDRVLELHSVKVQVLRSMPQYEWEL